MRDDPTVVTLVTRARAGDRSAWDEIIDRYAPLVWSICRKFRLSRADADDVGQTIWLLLLEQLPRLREPAALPGWLATATRRECMKSTHTADRRSSLEQHMDTEVLADSQSPPIDEDLLVAERNALLREGVRQLAPRCRQLISLLVQDPPMSYAEISAHMAMPIGAIGPTRSRCLANLRRCPAVVALIKSELEHERGGGGHDRTVVER